jgi:5-formyltetrahydrofolate cyclo-ligase
MSTIAKLKSAFRKSHKLSKKLSKDQIEAESLAVCAFLTSIDIYKSSKTVSVFLSMEGEINTTPIVTHLFESGKTVFVPKCDGKVMEVLRLTSLSDFNSLGKSS